MIDHHTLTVSLHHGRLRLMPDPKTSNAMLTFSTIWKADLEQHEGGVRSSRAPIASGTRLSNGFSISPGGDRVAISKGDAASSDIYVISLENGSSEQLTDLDGRNSWPVWSPDGRVIAFGSTHDGTPRVWGVSSDGG